ncbi:MAG: hypothetical protein U0169_03535 [Polyangiaceae bacterium]
MNPSLLGALLSSGLVLFAFACTKSATNGPSDAGSTDETPEQSFRVFEGDLVASCGGVNGGCHVKGTYVNPQGDTAKLWLGPGDAYAAAKGYPGIIPITGDANDSKLLTQVEHDGPALSSFPKLRESVAAWISAELRAGGVARPTTEAFYVREGKNTVALGALAAGADGAQLTFEAQQVGQSEFLTQMKVTAPASKGLRIGSVTFVILPATGLVKIAAASGFEGAIQIGAGKEASLFSGETVLTPWNPQNRVKIVFDKFEPNDAAPDAGVTGCKSVESFVTNAVPAFGVDLGGGRTCVSCHGADAPKAGSTEDVAVNTWDIRGLDTDPSAACARTLFHVNPADKAKSSLLTSPTGGEGGSPTHPVRVVCGQPQPPMDGGTPLCTPTDWTGKVQAWLANE